MIAIDTEYNQSKQLLILSYKLPNEDAVAVCTDFTTHINKLLSYNLPFVGHNIKADVYVIYVNTGILLTNVKDTMIVAKILTNDFKVGGKPYSLALDNLLASYGITMSKDVRSEFIKMNDVSYIKDYHLDYAKEDVKYLVSLYNNMYESIIERKQEYAVSMDEAMIPILVKMETNKVFIDRIKAKELEKKYVTLSKKLGIETVKLLPDYEAITKTVVEKKYKNGRHDVKIRYTNTNLNSWQQIQQIFKFYGVKIESTSKLVLQQWLDENKEHFLVPFVKSYLEYNDLTTLLSKYIIPLSKNTLWYNDKLSYTNTVYKLTSTTTGRLSSSKDGVSWYINLFNIPNRTVIGKEIKACFTCREGYVVVSSDMAQAEARIAGAVANDKTIIANFNEGLDMHSMVAVTAYNVLENKNESWTQQEHSAPYKHNGISYRDRAKTLFYSLLNGATESKIAEIYGVNRNVGTLIFNEASKALSGLQNFMKSQNEYAQKYGYVKSNSITNRRRYTKEWTQLVNFYWQS